MNLQAFANRQLEQVEPSIATCSELREQFVPTPTFEKFLARLFYVLELREDRMKVGSEGIKGLALIGPPGTGKTRTVRMAAELYADSVEARGGRQFGSKVITVTVPSRASVKDTCCEILRQLGYPITGTRTEDYLVNRVIEKLEEHRIAGLHLDEFQDAGKHASKASLEMFTKRFRNLMQSSRWPVSLILSGTMEARELLNVDKTLARRTQPIEIPPMDIDVEGVAMVRAIRQMLEKVGLDDDGLLKSRKFQARLIHAAAGRFGTSLEIAIETIEEALRDGAQTLTANHFAEAYYLRTEADDDLNPFVAKQYKAIDTTQLLDRQMEEKDPPKKRTSKQV